MRIIDKNTDFYDYLQNIYRDDSLTFDRTGSFVLSKEMLCKYLYVSDYFFNYERELKRKHYNFILLQVCNTFWLFLIRIKEFDKFGVIKDYDIELINNWKNYNRDRVLLSLDVIEINYSVTHQFYNWNRKVLDNFDIQKMISKTDILEQAINTNDYKVKTHIDKHIVYTGDNKPIEKNSPLLKACGIADFIDPLDIFLSFEEYFSTEKSMSERIEAIGATNNDKIESHGFDTKTSFRGKQ